MTAADPGLLATWFAAPGAAGLLLAAALLGVLLQRGRRRLASRLLTVIGRRAPILAGERDVDRDRWRTRLAVAGLLAAVLACMQPRFGSNSTAGTPPAADLCVCLDVSRSMLAGDVPPTRLAFAQQALAALGTRTRGDRMALLVFAGEARLRVPLTRDIASLLEIAGTVDPADVALGGTDLGAAIDAGVRALAGAGGERSATGAPHGALLLVTDGEDPSGAGRAAAERAQRAGIAVHCIGIGSALGSKITVTGADGRQSFLRDRAGNEVLTRLHATGLRDLAAAGGGLYLDAATTASPLVAAYERGVLPTLQARAADAADGSDQRGNRFQLPLALALLALLAELLLPHRRRAAGIARHGGGA